MSASKGKAAMFAVTVTFQIKPNRVAEFISLIRENATASVRGEADCHQFDVCTDPARPEEVFLYELYTDEAGFKTHTTTPHFLKFDGQTADMIETKSAAFYERVHP